MQMRLRVAARLRELRGERQLSQERLAELAGIARHSIYRTELATHSASLDHLSLIADALGVPLSLLVKD
ncbi:helix-turn-helix transcriptional regulator [Streptomyces sp. V4-01]|uniref:Helix-turn-helix transcriptional regulator n=1 Tax=Actinacidiphila polyblastidii TaxID=3110430 RepID=A0ABU7PKR0_9ACTN|nr:helix-turn-helix transcriptional regulator [Streptomyces sp. V4-01]